MQHDDLIWTIINNEFCSYKSKLRLEKQTFCRNPYSLTGLCNKRTCPLANSRYATLREEKGEIFLCMKTIERAHTPRKLWEKVKLPKNYEASIKVIDKELQYWPSFIIHKTKQRLTRMHEVLKRMRKLRTKVTPELEIVQKKTEKREAVREKKAESAAKLEKAIESELLERLKKGVYGDIYNFPEKNFDNVMDENEEEQEEEEEEPEIEYVEDMDDSEMDMDAEDMYGDEEDMNPKGKKGKKSGIELEYEEEESDKDELQE